MTLCWFEWHGRLVGAALVSALACVAASGCSRTETDATPLPTRQTTIDPVKAKLDAAQQEAERRRTDAERAAQ